MTYWLGIILSFLVLSAQAITLDELQQRLQAPQIVRAHFEQTRTISTMKKPLVSSGRVLISKEQGIWWSQDKPFAQTMVFTNTAMIQKMDGQNPTIITAEQQPQLFQFNRLMRALLEADQTLLKQNFKVALQEMSASQWQLTLVPTVSPIDKLFSKIVVTGKANIDQVYLFDRQGDKTEIRFFQQSSQPEKLSNEEQQYFVY